jgi:predicted AAA+ superfamily ATPase
MTDHLLRPGCRQFEVHYWRYKGHGFDVEVDFVLESGGRLVSIEVKSGRDRQRGGWEKFRTEFAERFHREVLVADRGVPLNEFLLQPPARWFDEEP